MLSRIIIIILISSIRQKPSWYLRQIGSGTKILSSKLVIYHSSKLTLKKYYLVRIWICKFYIDDGTSSDVNCENEFSKNGSDRFSPELSLYDFTEHSRSVSFRIIALDVRPESQTIRRADSALFTPAGTQREESSTCEARLVICSHLEPDRLTLLSILVRENREGLHSHKTAFHKLTSFFHFHLWYFPRAARVVFLYVFIAFLRASYIAHNTRVCARLAI